jgi:serine/threonine-protein kinase
MEKNKVISTNKNEYTILEKVGEGGSATVWKAIDKNESIVAIKFLKTDDKMSEKVLERFINEIGFQKGTSSKYIVKVIDDKLENGSYLYVMPYYQKNLKDIMKDSLSPSLAIKYFIHICKGLQHAHKKAIHRDIKPENIFYDEKNDCLKIGDFGVARFKKFNITKKGERLANFDYHAPEQLKRSKIKVGPFTDIYSLGLILNEMFTGEIPLGASYKKIEDINFIYSFFDNLIDQMTSNQVELRPQTITDVISDVKLYVNTISKEINTVKESLFDKKNNGFTREEFKKIKEQISIDIVTANRLLNNSQIDWNKIEANYHMNYGYSANENLINSCIQIEIHKHLYNKFSYESNAYNDDNTYASLNLENELDASLYKEYCALISRYNGYEETMSLSKESKKYFQSLVNYHSKEMLDNFENTVSVVKKDLEDAPILWISRNILDFVKLYKSLTRDEFDISEYVTINWNRVSLKIENDSVYSTYYAKKQNEISEITKKLKSKFRKLIIKKSLHGYKLMFISKEQYTRFSKLCDSTKEKYNNDSVTYADIEGVKNIDDFIGNLIVLHLDGFEFEKILPKILSHSKQ